MTAAAAIELITWAAQAVKAIVDVVQEAIKKAEPPSMDELKKNLHNIIDARHEDWTKAAKADADKALAESAAAEFDKELASALSKDKK